MTTRLIPLRDFRLKMQDHLTPGTILLTVRGKVAYTVEIHEGDTRDVSGGAGRDRPTTREPDRKVESVLSPTPAPGAGTSETQAAKLARLRGLQTAVLAGEHPVPGGETVPDSSSDRPNPGPSRPRKFSEWDIGRRNAWLRKNYPGTFDPEAQDQEAVTEWLNSLPEEPAE